MSDDEATELPEMVTLTMGEFYKLAADTYQNRSSGSDAYKLAERLLHEKLGGCRSEWHGVRCKNFHGHPGHHANNSGPRFYASWESESADAACLTPVPPPETKENEVSEMDRREFLELWERLVKARSEIDKLCDRAAYLHNMSEFSRLDGKRQGISLAMSYLDDMERARA